MNKSITQRIGTLFAICAAAAVAGCDMNPDEPVLHGTRPSEAVEAPPAPPQPAGAVRRSPPNIVFILVDDLGWGDVGFNGSEIRTPTIDALLASGARLNRYYTYSICSPTRAALLTGRPAFSTGVDGPMASDQGLPLSFKLLPERLKAAGYDTALAGKWHLGAPTLSHLPNQRGFDSFYGFLHGFVDHYTHITPWGALDWQRDGETLREEGYSTDLLTDEAVRVIKDRNKDRPFFLYLSYGAPHSPVQAPDEYVERYADIDDVLRREYAGMVEAMDAGVGRVVETLETEGVAENTLIIWTSDNGGNLFAGADNGDLRGGKGTAFEGGVRAPSVMNWPGVISPATVIEDLTSVHDWAPTIVELANGEPDEAFAGNDLMPLISDAGAANSASFVVGGGRPTRRINQAVFSWPWKLVTSTERNATGAASGLGSGSALLFNIDADPRETEDLAADNPDIVERLLATLADAPMGPSLTETADLGGVAGSPEDPAVWMSGFEVETAPTAMDVVLAATDE